MDAFFRSIPVLLIFPTLVALTWIRGGTNGDMLVPTVPWLLALVFEVLICFPQRHYGEDAVQARQRCWRRVGRDPVFFLTLLFLVVVLGIPFLNKGMCPTCDYDTIMANLTPAEFEQLPDILADKAPNPPVPFAPFCVNLRQHFEVLMWFLPSLVAMLAARHALLRSGKRMLVEMLVWNAAALAVFGFVQRATGAKFVMMWDETAYNALRDSVRQASGLSYAHPNPDFFATFGYPNMGGCFFMLAFAMSLGVWMTRVREVEAEPKSSKAEVTRQRLLLRFIRSHYALVPVSINFIAVLFTFCRAAILMSLGIAAFAFIYYILRMLLARVDRARQVQRAAFNFVGAVLLLLAGVVFAPDRKGVSDGTAVDISGELKTISTIGLLDRVTGKNEHQPRIALELVKKYPVFGCGGWGYKHLSLNQMTPDDLKNPQAIGAANVHNDYLQFLCEHGIVGLGCLVAIFFCLIVPIFRDWGRLYRAARFLSPEAAPASPRAIYCFPPGAFWILVGCFAVAFHAVADAPLRSGAVLSLFFVSLACADGYLPHQSEPRP